MARRSKQHKLHNRNEHRNDNVTNFQPYLEQNKKRQVQIIPRNLNQEQYLELLLDPNKSIVIATGPAGTGKTLLAMQAAIKGLKERQYDKIIMTRPAVGVENEKHGFLPGDLFRKMEPWTKPLFDVLHEYYTTRETQSMVENDVVEICPLAFMRGRTFKKAIIIADEMQNATPAQAKMLMTRIGGNSRIVITGAVEQADRSKGDNGLMDLCDRLQAHPVRGIAVCPLESRDVQRHKIIGDVLKLYSR